MHYATLFGPLILSALVVVILQLPNLDRDEAVTLATFMSGAAALLSTFGAFGGFKEKWFAHRSALLKVDLISLGLRSGQLPAQQAGEDIASVLKEFSESWARSV